jgi:glycosyltransferase involved in cell wall biosynthesis
MTLNFIDMMGRRGHRIIHYGNEGSEVPCQHVQIFSEEERTRHFGYMDLQKPPKVTWDGQEVYHKDFNQRVADELKARCRPTDFICSIFGDCQKEIGKHFPGCYDRIPSTNQAENGKPAGFPLFVEFAIGYLGAFSAWRVFATNTLREWWHGHIRNPGRDFGDVVIPHFFDKDIFGFGLVETDNLKMKGLQAQPYMAFVGRVNEDKGVQIAVDVTRELGIPLVIAGRDTAEYWRYWPKHVTYWGAATIKERNQIMQGAICTFAPTLYREPFGSVAVEALLSGTPCITTDYGGLVEIVDKKWRCHGLREFIDAAKRAMALTTEERRVIKDNALSRFSYDAIAPQYERYFERLAAMSFGQGWNELRPVDEWWPGAVDNRTIQYTPIAPLADGTAIHACNYVPGANGPDKKGVL